MNKEIYLSSSATIPFKSIMSLFFPSLSIISAYFIFTSTGKDALAASLFFLIAPAIMGILIWILLRNMVATKIIGDKFISQGGKKKLHSKERISKLFL